MKVKTFTVIVVLLLFLAVLSITYYAQDTGLHMSPIAPTEEPDDHYFPSTMPVLTPGMTLPEVNESALNLTPMTLSTMNQSTLNLTQSNDSTEHIATPVPSGMPRSTPMAPMKPMEPWKPAAPMKH